MATEVIKTVKPSGGDYTSLAAWEAGQQANLVTADQIQIAECYAMSDTAAVLIDGWTTDATRYIRIYTPATERHDGKWNASRYRMEMTLTANGQYAVDNREDYVRIDGLQILINFNGGNWTGANGIYVYWSINALNDIRISNNLIRASNLATWSKGAGININDADAVVKIRNNVVYDFKSTNAAYGKNGILVTACANAYVYNNTVQNCTEGVARVAGTVVAKNIIAQDCTDGFAGTFDGASDYNLSDLASDAPGPNSRNSTTVTFVDKTNDDFHLASGDAGARDYGTDQSGDATFPFSDDVDGQTRSGTWDIGADEYAGSGALYNESTTLGAGFSMAEAHTLSLNETLTLAAQLGITQGSRLDAVADLTLAYNAVVNGSATAIYVSTTTLGAILVVALSAAIPGQVEKSGQAQKMVHDAVEWLKTSGLADIPVKIVHDPGSPGKTIKM